MKNEHPQPPFPEQHQDKPGIEALIDPAPLFLAESYKPAGKLKNKVALITGGDSGIGKAVANIYAKEGANVAIVFLPSEIEDAKKIEKIIQEYGRECLLIPGDLTDPEFCIECVDTTVKKLGSIDILVHNAAYQNRISSLDELTEEEWDKTYQTNIYALYRLCRASVKLMKPGSSIITTSSETGIEGSPKLLAYSSTKGAINAFTKTLAMDLVEKCIRVNAVAPGPVWTPLNVVDIGNSPKDVSIFGSKTLFKRPAQPEEIAPTYVFLASEADSSFITGTVIRIMGKTSAG